MCDNYRPVIQFVCKQNQKHFQNKLMMKIQILKMMMHLVFYMKICQYLFGKRRKSVSNLERGVHEIWKCVLYVLESLVCLLVIFS